MLSKAHSALTLRHRGGTICIDPSITEHKDILVLGDSFIPICPSGGMLLEQAIHTPSLFFKKRPSSIVDLNGNVNLAPREIVLINEGAILVGGSKNYYHWLIDYLPRILFCMESMSIKEYKVLINENPSHFQLETLSHIGVESSQLVELSSSKNYSLSRLIFPGLLSSTTVPHPLIKELVDKYFHIPQNTQKKNIYLSRRDALSRRVVNEEDVIRILRKYDFEIHVTGSMSVIDQIQLCSSASIMLSVHGAAMANLLFCPADSRILEIYTPNHKVTSMSQLAKMCGLKHSFLAAKNVSYGLDGNPLLGDWHLDTKSVEAAIRSALSPP